MKKYTKIFVVPLLVVLVSVMTFLLAACENNKNEWTRLESSECCVAINPELTGAYLDNHSKSTVAYEEAIVYFTTADGKRTDDFGGIFIDENGIYNICVIGNRKPVKSDYLKYKRVKNSYNLLEKIVDELGNRSQEFSIWMASTCETCNRVLICLEEESKIDLLMAHLKVNNLFKKGTLNVFVGTNQIVSN